MSRQIGKGVLGLLFVSTVALACGFFTIMAMPVEVSAFQSIGDDWEEIGDQLEQQFGSAGVNSEISVKIPVKVCALWICAPPFEQNMLKPCGKTMKQAAYDLAEYARRAEANQGGSGGGAVSGGYGEVPGEKNPFEQCFSETIKSCATSSSGTLCRYDTYLTCPMG